MGSIRIFVATLIFFVTAVSAETYVQINGASIHSQPGYNGGNLGLGLEHDVTKDWSVAGGFYKNSEYRDSVYAYGRWTAYRDEHWNLGIGLGAVTGYKRMSVLPMAFPEACYDYVCAMFLPQIEPGSASVVGFHLKVPLN